MIRGFLFLVMFLVVVVSPVVAQVEAYTVSNESLFRIDLDTGSEALIGPTNVTALFRSLALSSSGVLYGIGDNLMVGPDALYVLDRGTGGATLVGDLGVEDLRDITVTSSGGLWAHQAGTLYSIDAATGVATSVVALDQPVHSLASRNDEVFAIDSGPGVLNVYRVDTTSGDLDQVLAAPTTFGGSIAADFDPFGGLRFHTIYGGVLSVIDHGFYRVDLSTGDVEETYRHSYGLLDPIGEMRAIAIIDGGSVVGIPTLGSRPQMALMVLLLVAGFWFVRRGSGEIGATE